MLSLEEVGYPQWLLGGLIVVLVAGLLWAGSTSAVAFGAYNPAWDGSQEARELASATAKETVVIRDVGRYKAVAPDRTTAIVLAPERPYGDAAAADIRQFVREGGTLVVAADTVDTAVANDLLRAVGTGSRINGSLLRDEQRYAASPAMPLATTVNESRWTRDVSALAVNYGSVVEPANGSEVSVVVRSSQYGYLDTNRNATLDASETLDRYPIVVVESVGEGRVIVVSDPSVFINAMLSRGDNRAFARNLYRTDTVAFDYSHTGGVPPLVEVVLVLRSSALALLAVGGLLVVGAVVAMEGTPVPSIRAWLEGETTAVERGEGPALSTNAVAEYIREHHPEWDEERVQRVAESVAGKSD